jgi:hypothetical protein
LCHKSRRELRLADTETLEYGRAWWEGRKS